MNFLHGIKEVADNYKVLFCDAWGVIHNGIALLPGSNEALCNFTKKGGAVIIITNAPRPSEVIKPQLDHIRLSPKAYNKIVTSGDVCVHLITKQKNKPAFRLGPSKDDDLFRSLGIKFVPLDQAEYILCTGMLNDMSEKPEDYEDFFLHALQNKLPMICVNPDKIVHYGDQILYCAGALAEFYENMGGKVEYCGKPFPEIYDLALDHARKYFPDIKKSEILCIGDNFQTDILGAKSSGYDVLYVKSGVGSNLADNEVNYVSDLLQW